MKKLAIFCCGLLFSGMTQASALYFYEIGTEDTALAGAGQAARAQDASTIASNPAGMTRLPEHMLTTGVQMMDGDVSFDMANSNNGPGDVMKPFPNASLFYSQRLSDNVYAGIGMYGNFGLGLDFGNWAGQHVINKSTMVGMTISPSIAWKLSDKVSVGFGPGINYGYLSLRRDVDGHDSSQHDTDWSMNYKLGLLMDLTDQTRMGITWTSKTDYDFDIDSKVHLPNRDYTLPLAAQVRAPQQIMLSLVHDINRQWSVMGDLGWQDWSQFGSPKITAGNRDLTHSNRLKDSWHTALGVQYRPDEKWRINGGIAFDSTVYESQGDVSLSMPTGDEWRFATGAQYQITPSSNIGFAVEYLHMQSSKVRAPEALKGEYNHPYFWFASINYSYQF